MRITTTKKELKQIVLQESNVKSLLAEINTSLDHIRRNCESYARFGTRSGGKSNYEIWVEKYGDEDYIEYLEEVKKVLNKLLSRMGY